MTPDLNKFFKYLNLYREDIKEELDLLGAASHSQRVCDFGCGSGLATFALALEMEKSNCMGIDLFDGGSGLLKLNHLTESIEQSCEDNHLMELYSKYGLCKLNHEKRLPKFIQGNIVLNQGMPENLDLAYCKKLLLNIKGKKYTNTTIGEEALIPALRNISGSLHLMGKLVAIEYDRKFKLEKVFELCQFQVVKRSQIKRREIRSRGRTHIISTFTLYLCQKQG